MTRSQLGREEYRKDMLKRPTTFQLQLLWKYLGTHKWRSEVGLRLRSTPASWSLGRVPSEKHSRASWAGCTSRPRLPCQAGGCWFSHIHAPQPSSCATAPSQVGDSGGSSAKQHFLTQKTSLRPQPNPHLGRGTIPFHLEGLKGHQRSPFIVFFVPHPPVRRDMTAVADGIAAIAGRAAALPPKMTTDTR